MKSLVLDVVLDASVKQFEGTLPHDDLIRRQRWSDLCITLGSKNMESPVKQQTEHLWLDSSRFFLL